MDATAGLEIERKFLLAEIPARLDQYPHECIDQGYVTFSPGDTEIRLRRKGAKYFLTAKRGHGTVRREIEIRLRKKQFETLWPLTKGRRLRKVRYEVPWNQFLITLDVYKGRHRGLKVAEVEFTSRAQSRRFIPPVWFGQEVTRNKRYRNRSLAQE
jgi:CYTH domain-containing protein